MRLMSMFASAPVQEPRPKNSYPVGLCDPLETQFSLYPKASVADIGAGSGRLTMSLLEHRFAVTAVEQRPHKLEACAALKNRFPQLQVSAGSATATGLPSASVDLVSSSRALYLPNRKQVRAEFKRILKPGGLVLLITDNRVYTGGEQAEAYEDLLRQHCPNFREKTIPCDIGESVETFYGGPVYEDAFLSHECYTLEEFLKQTRGLAIYPVAPDPQCAAIESALAAFFRRWSIADQLIIPKICRAAYGHLIG